MRALPFALLLAACASPATPPPHADGTADAQVAATRARSAAAPEACHDVGGEGYAKYAPASRSTSTMGSFVVEASSGSSQTMGCSGVGDDNACEVVGETWIKASVPGAVGYWHVPAAMRAYIVTDGRTVSCRMGPA